LGHAVDQLQQEQHVARESIQLGDDQLRLPLLASCNRRVELKTGCTFAAFDFDELTDDLPAATVEAITNSGLAKRD
jgi:hypothetical protein